MASRSLNDLAKPVKDAALLMQARCKLAGLNILIYRTLVSNAEQDELYRTGKGRLTNARAGQSFHNPDSMGKAWAFDAAPLASDGSIQWSNVEAFNRMGVIAEKCGLEWSGRWTGRFREVGHFQMKKNNLIDEETMNRANEAVTVEVSKADAAKKLAIKSAIVGAIALALPVLETIFPQYIPVIKTLAGLLSFFGMGA